MTAAADKPARTSGARIAVQKFGTFLSGMIMPNIAAFIAWGFITALFIEEGPFPVGGLGGFGVDDAGDPNIGLVGPMIRFMLPLLIAMQGGRMVYGVRGGVVAVVATMGVIVSTDQPMFLGALIMAPLAAWVMKQLDKLWDGKIKPGFEMLVNNFSAGIAAAALAVLGFFSFGPVIEKVSRVARQRRRLAGRQQPAAAGQHHHRAGQGALPEQRHQPRRADPARGPAGRARTASRSSSCSRPTPGPASASCWPTALRHRPGPKPPRPGPPSSTSSAGSTRSTSRTC